MESSVRHVTYNKGSNNPVTYPASQQDSWAGTADSLNWISDISAFSATSGTVRTSKVNSESPLQFFGRENAEGTHYVQNRRFDAFFRDSLPLWIYELPATLSDELSAALSDLQEVNEEAQEEGFPVPSPIAFDNAERCLRAMYEISPRRYEVYPTHDGEIVIDAPSGFGASVVLMCDSAGGALCLANLKNGQRYRQYASAHACPDDFLRDSLIALERERN